MNSVVINKVFQPLYTTKKRYIVLTGGRGSAKTFTVQDFLIRLLEEVGQKILYTRFTMRSVEKTIIPLFSKHIELISDYKKYHITKNLITNKVTGTSIMFSGIKTSSGDQTANLKTLPDITTWVIEEGEDFNNEASFDDIDDSVRVKGTQNRIIWIQNPTTAEHFLYKKFFKDSHIIKYVDEAGQYLDSEGNTKRFYYQKCTHPDVEHIHTTYHMNIDNLNKKKVELWEEVRVIDPKKYQHKLIGAWLDKAEGVIFDNWIEGAFDESLIYGYGQDYGFSIDPTTLVKVAVDKKRKRMYWHEEYYESKKIGTGEIYEVNKARIGKKNDLIIADSQEGRLIQDLRKKGLNIQPCVKGQGSVTAGLSAMSDYLHIVTPESSNIKKELNNYCWNDKKAGIPIDDYNHAIDAARYIFQYFNNPKGIIASRKRKRQR